VGILRCFLVHELFREPSAAGVKAVTVPHGMPVPFVDRAVGVPVVNGEMPAVPIVERGMTGAPIVDGLGMSVPNIDGDALAAGTVSLGRSENSLIPSRRVRSNRTDHVKSQHGNA
jgi:hypothetical protein